MDFILILFVITVVVRSSCVLLDRTVVYIADQLTSNDNIKINDHVDPEPKPQARDFQSLHMYLHTLYCTRRMMMIPYILAVLAVSYSAPHDNITVWYSMIHPVTWNLKEGMELANSWRDTCDWWYLQYVLIIWISIFTRQKMRCRSLRRFI